MISTDKTEQVIESPDTAEAKPWRLADWCLVIWFVASGLVSDWHCASEWFTGRYTHFSAPVLSVMGLIVVFCASIAFLAACLFGGRWRSAVLVFSLFSYTLSGYMLTWSDV